VSDTYLRLIPDDRSWQPTTEAAASAAAYVADLFSGDGAEVDRVEAKFYDRVTLIDAGMYTERITCPQCGADIRTDWLGEVVRANGGVSFNSLRVTVPCCAAATEMDSLHYENPIGFARFEVSALNPFRVQGDELDGTELARVAHLLGHPIVQIIAHY
jgi:hypothetical protein